MSQHRGLFSSLKLIGICESEASRRKRGTCSMLLIEVSAKGQMLRGAIDLMKMLLFYTHNDKTLI